ncbi:hypothetical protein, partial [Deinococcus sp.]|uniref:hypothetical protein n=1 Tax=Deinococcus sp. TaxID=47478 RepID=UPI0025E9AF55
MCLSGWGFISGFHFLAFEKNSAHAYDDLTFSHGFSLSFYRKEILLVYQDFFGSKTKTTTSYDIFI